MPILKKPHVWRMIFSLFVFFSFPLFSEESSIPCSSYINFRHIDGGGVGYKKGYSTVDGCFFPYRGERNFHPLIDIRLHLMNDGNFATNMGLGSRFYIKDKRIVGGMNIFYDYRHSAFSHSYHQMGVGIELISELFDLRANGYLPFNREKMIYSYRVNYPGGYYYQENRYEIALYGLDIELSRTIDISDTTRTYLGIGPYFYTGLKCCSIKGVQFRARLDLGNYVSFEGHVTHDPILRTKVQGAIIFRLPIGCDSMKKHNLFTRFLYRNEIIALDQHTFFKKNY